MFSFVAIAGAAIEMADGDDVGASRAGVVETPLFLGDGTGEEGFHFRRRSGVLRSFLEQKLSCLMRSSSVMMMVCAVTL